MRLAFLGALVALFYCIAALQIQLDNPQSIRDAASRTAHGSLYGWYGGNETGAIPGSFPDKWWEGSVLFTSLLYYWYYTGDDQYNALVSQGMQWQAGEGDYLPKNYSRFLGNDDQYFWGAAAMTAAEFNFPEVHGGFSWLSLAQGVFNTQTVAWDNTTCDGGLRWQLFPYQGGWTLKNSISTGGFFQLAARLARYTHNNTYADWAQKAWDWTISTPLVDIQTWNVADSTDPRDNCTSQGNNQWSYNYGIYLSGAAFMYNYTEKAEWKHVVDSLLGRMLMQFYPERYGGGKVFWEACDSVNLCNNNEKLFKGIVSMWLATVALLVPDTYDLIFPKLQTTAQAAALSCSGAGNDSCSVKWYESKWDGTIGMEQQISATSILSSVLVSEKRNPPLTSRTGGNSTSNPTAGGFKHEVKKPRDITTADRVGAGILTALFVGGWGTMMVWMFLGGPNTTKQHASSASVENAPENLSQDQPK
ncbi:glycosyl hydrolase family 76-domain-containing protein [Aspergillus karnatakaensis]|uniref:glycoside hydrolase family 76 protein n=1 Tax=Aspergillus karnatakaensis TaxID=1810916 RepID=UPI003CCD97D7